MQAMVEVTCFHCGHVAHISPDVERCAVCSADLRHLITPEIASHYFYDRAAQMAAGGEVTLALLEVERGLAYYPTSELYLLGAILAQRLGDAGQVRRHVAAIPVDDVLRPEAEWLLRSQQANLRSRREMQKGVIAPDAESSSPRSWQAGAGRAGYRPERPTAVRVNPFLYGAVALALVLLVLWFTVEPLAEIVWSILPAGQSGLVQTTPTVAAPPEPPPAGEGQEPAVTTPTPTPEIPSDLVQSATPEPQAAQTPLDASAGVFDLAGFLRQTNRPELAELEVSATLREGTLKLQGVVGLFDQRASLVELAERAPGVAQVDAVDLLVRLPDTYTVQAGDSLWLISYKLYGGNRVDDLYNANRDVLASPEALQAGQTLRVPPQE